MGSKNRIAKHILPIMLKEAQNNNIHTWVEPFVGGGNIIDKVPQTFKRIGADCNKYAIEALLLIRDCVNELPKNNLEFTEEDYELLKNNDSNKYKGFASFAYSFGSKFLGGWSRNSKGCDYVKRAFLNAVKQSPNLQGVELVNCIT